MKKTFIYFIALSGSALFTLSAGAQQQQQQVQAKLVTGNVNDKTASKPTVSPIDARYTAQPKLQPLQYAKTPPVVAPVPAAVVDKQPLGVEVKPAPQKPGEFKKVERPNISTIIKPVPQTDLKVPVPKPVVAKPVE